MENEYIITIYFDEFSLIKHICATSTQMKAPDITSYRNIAHASFQSTPDPSSRGNHYPNF